VNQENEKSAAVSAGGKSGGTEEKVSAGGWFSEMVRTWGPAIFAVLVIRTFIFEPFRIPSGSMVPTLLIGDHVVVTKFSYGIWLPFIGKELIDLGNPSRGDIIVFKYPRDPSMNYIKRVVALPGDRVRVRNNRVFINGEEQNTVALGDYDFIDDDCFAHPERYFKEKLGNIEHAILTNPGLGGPLADMDERVVPADNVFVMGDNRDNSEDSRRWGFVRFDQIKGKAHRVWLSWDGCASGVGSVRTDRFFQSLYGNPPPAK
jgi:signal peptidase I